MGMIALAVIGFLVLLVIYLVVRGQSTQRDLGQYKNSLKSTDSQAKYALATLQSVSSELQKTYVSRLEANRKRGIIGEEDYVRANFILTNVHFVIMQCVEHRHTVEEAINKALEESELSITDINQYIAKQPSEIRMPWVKNSITAFITACNNISVGVIKVQSHQESQSAESGSDTQEAAQG